MPRRFMPLRCQLTRGSCITRGVKSSTIAVIPSSPPRRSNKDCFSVAWAALVCEPSSPVLVAFLTPFFPATFARTRELLIPRHPLAGALVGLAAAGREKIAVLFFGLAAAPKRWDE